MPIKLQGTNSAAAPGLTNDGGDGIVVGTDSVDISTGGTSRLKVDSSGRVDLGGSTNSSTGIGVLRTKHHTTSNNPVNMIGCVSGSGYNNVQIGGNDTSFTGTAATNVRFYTGANATTANGTLRGYWDGSGNLGISDGNLVIGTAGHGIDFSATADGATGSTNSELFADYEEGSFTPTWTGVTNTTNRSVWRYTKIGDQCRIWGRFTADTTTNNTTEIEVGNLPYTSKDNFNNSWSEATSAVMIHSVEQDNNATFAYIYWNRSAFKFYQTQQSGAWDSLKSSDIAVGDHMVVDLTYTAV